MNNRSPFAIGTVILLVIGIIVLIPVDQLLSDQYFTAFQIEYMALILKMTPIFLMGLMGVRKIKLPALSGLSSQEQWHAKLLNLIPTYLFFIGMLAVIGKDLAGIDLSNLLLLLLACLLVGFAEEFVFRGFLQPLFLRRFIQKKNGLFLGVMFPAMFFGFSHLLNLTVNDNVPQVIVQTLYAILIGFFFGVLLLKTNKLLPIAITHGLINFFFLFSALPGIKSEIVSDTSGQIESSMINQILAYIIPLLMFLPLFVIGLIVLRNVNKEQVCRKLT